MKTINNNNESPKKIPFLSFRAKALLLLGLSFWVTSAVINDKVCKSFPALEGKKDRVPLKVTPQPAKVAVLENK